MELNTMKIICGTIELPFQGACSLDYKNPGCYPGLK